jgi:hypothetical protein
VHERLDRPELLVDVGNCPVHRRLVGHVGLDGDQPSLEGAETVPQSLGLLFVPTGDGDVMAILEKAACDGAAQRSRPSGDQDLAHGNPLSARRLDVVELFVSSLDR